LVPRANGLVLTGWGYPPSRAAAPDLAWERVVRQSAGFSPTTTLATTLNRPARVWPRWFTAQH